MAGLEVPAKEEPSELPFTNIQQTFQFYFLQQSNALVHYDRPTRGTIFFALD